MTHRSLINSVETHDITMSTLDSNRGIHLFLGRAVGLSSPEDKVQLHPDLAADWPCLREHYARIGARA